MAERRRRSLSSGSKIGKYELREAIRRQPERSLFNAYDPFLDRTVAIKIIQLFAPGSDEQSDAIETFFTEARAIARLQHQNIVSVYDAGMGDYEGFMVMEFVHGQSLLQRLKQQNRLPVDESLQIAIQVSHALRYAHDKKIVHRDIKPSNIMLTNDGEIKLVDFGISFVRSEDEHHVPGLVGTPSYMAPELLEAKVPSEQSDQFSLGVVLYEMVTGRLPFTGTDAHEVLYKIISDEPAAVEEGSASLSALIFKMLAKDPTHRFDSTQELERELQDLADLSFSGIENSDGIDALQLKKTNVFADCDLEVLQELARCAQIILYAEDEVIDDITVHQSNEYCFVLAGQIQSSSATDGGIVGAGSWLPSLPVQENLRQAAYVTLAPTQILQMSGDRLQVCSLSTQAYFYRTIAHNLILKQH